MKARQYELTLILAPDLDEAEKTKSLDRVTGIITEQFGGEMRRMDDWGRRKLAYEIRKHSFGDYIYLRFTAPAETIAEVERVMRLMDSIIKFLTVRLEDDTDDMDGPPPSTRYEGIGPDVAPEAEEAPAEGAAVSAD